jgi:hypothetical protein
LSGCTSATTGNVRNNAGNLLLTCIFKDSLSHVLERLV